MGRAQREKGKRGELEVRDVLRAAGFDSDRTPNSGGLHIPADVSMTFRGEPCGIHIEAKRHERVRLTQWIAQAAADCPDGELPVVVWRQNGGTWRADLDLESFAQLLAELFTLRHERSVIR